MNAKALFFGLGLCLAAGTPAMPQGFAGLGTEVEGYAVPIRGTPFTFPADHGPHEAYRIEWWYLTATLSGPGGTDYGLQWTLFRSALRPGPDEGWGAGQLYMGHAAITTPDSHFVAERLGRGAIGQAGVTPDPFRAWIDDWHLTTTAPPGADAFSGLQVSARGDDFAYALDMAATGPLIFHGDRGYSVKSDAGQASYYYSQPFLAVSGILSLPEGDIPVTGQAWIDREWSSQPLAEDQTGWDWFSLAFDDGARLMAFGLRSRDGGHFTSATHIAPDGTTRAFGDGAVRLTPLGWHETAGRRLPVRWRVELPALDLDVETEPLNPDAWMATSFPYWEGPLRFSGSHVGRGYLEMTGYE